MQSKILKQTIALLLATILLIPSVSSFEQTKTDSSTTFDLPLRDFIFNFFRYNYFVNEINSNEVNCQNQFLGIIALLSLYNSTKDEKYKENALKVYNYSERFFDGLYAYSSDDDTKYTLNNSYAIISLLELYKATNNNSFLERAEKIANNINFNNTFFFTEDNNSVELKSQALASYSFLKLYEQTKNVSYLKISMSALNYTIENYLTDGYKISEEYFAIENAMLTFATYYAYKTTKNDFYKNATQRSAWFLLNMSAFLQTNDGYIFDGIFTSVKKENNEIIPVDERRLPIVNLWTYFAYSKVGEFNSSYLNQTKFLQTILIQKNWDYSNIGFSEEGKKHFETTAFALIIFNNKINLKHNEIEQRIKIVVQKKTFANMTRKEDFSNVAISSFTIFSEEGIRNLTVFGKASTIKFFNLYYKSISKMYVLNESLSIQANFDSNYTNYFVFFTNLNKGENNFTFVVENGLRLSFVNSTITKEKISINLFSPIQTNITYSEFLLESSNITITFVKVNGKNLNFTVVKNFADLDSGKRYTKVIINDTISFPNELEIFYSDNEEPRTKEILFRDKEVYGNATTNFTKDTDIWVECSVEDNNLIKKVELFYNYGEGWKSKEMYLKMDRFRANIGKVNSSEVKIYIRAEDIYGNVYESENYTIRAKNIVEIENSQIDYTNFYLFVILGLFLVGVVFMAILILVGRRVMHGKKRK